ncbi:MAG: hypothetical protein ACT4PW_14515 [Acidimicrobiia bacterium]
MSEGADDFDLDLDAAMNAVMSESYTDEVPDIIRNKDFPLLWPERRAEILIGLIDGTYQPHSPQIVEVPKSALATRPIAVLDLGDRIVYQALMTSLGPLLDNELVEEVRSARLYKTKAGNVKQQKQIDAWVKFQKSGREMCDLYGRFAFRVHHRLERAA